MSCVTVTLSLLWSMRNEDAGVAAESNRFLPGELATPVRVVDAPPEKAQRFCSFAETECAPILKMGRQDFEPVVEVLLTDFDDPSGDRDACDVLLPVLVFGKRKTLG